MTPERDLMQETIDRLLAEFQYLGAQNEDSTLAQLDQPAADGGIESPAIALRV